MTECLDVPGTVRRARRIADLSQRQLATAVRVSPTTIARAESDGRATLALLERVLAVAGLRLVVLDSAGEPVSVMRPDAVRDRSGRRLPAHLDPFPYWGVGLPYRADRPYPRPPGSVSFRRRRVGVRWERTDRPDDHPTPAEVLPRRRPPRPVYVPGEDCRCGPECERLCVESCECQCEPGRLVRSGDDGRRAGVGSGRPRRARSRRPRRAWRAGPRAPAAGRRPAAGMR